MLLSVVVGLALSCVTALAGAESLPVYIKNAQTGVSSNSILDHEAVPALISHFLGDGRETLSEDNAAVLKYVPSRFLQSGNAAVVLVHDFDASLAEQTLGSPGFFIGEESLSGLTARASKSSVGKFEREVTSDEDNVISLDAVQDGLDYNQLILDTIDGLGSVKVMLIGIPGSTQGAIAARRSTVKNASGLSYAQIPAFFDSEQDCASITNECAGHGSCVKTSNGKYSCQCRPTTAEDYTYYWGGNDCSKRDVSFQFNLIVGTTLAIAAASFLSIGLLINLGSEPLPGVLNTSTL